MQARFRRVTEVSSLAVQGEAFRVLKEEEKLRCEKENFLLNMLKMSRTLGSDQKMYCGWDADSSSGRAC